MSDELMPAGVSPLFGIRRPAAVHRPTILAALLAVTAGIISVIVLSIYGQINGGSLSHVIEEVLEVQPSLTDGDSPATITGKVVVLGIEASGFHVAPNPIFGGVCFSVSGFPLNDFINLEASAGFAVSRNQGSGRDINFLAAFTLAFPFVKVAGDSDNTEGGQPSEFLTRQLLQVSSGFDFMKGRAFSGKDIAHDEDGLMFSGRIPLERDCVHDLIFA